MLFVYSSGPDIDFSGTGNIYIDERFDTAVSMYGVVLPKKCLLLSPGSVGLASRAVYAFW